MEVVVAVEDVEVDVAMTAGAKTEATADVDVAAVVDAGVTDTAIIKDIRHSTDLILSVECRISFILSLYRVDK